MEIIGKGRNGTVYKINKGSKKYALKKSKIPDLNALDFIEKFKKSKLELKDTNHKYLRSIYFNKFINKINTNHFSILYKYSIDDCDFQHELNLDSNKFKPSSIEKNDKLNTQKYCLSLLYDLKDGDLSKIYSKLNKKQYYSLIIQINYALYIMHQNGFYHLDIHAENICFVKTKQEYIKIFKYDIPTYGYIFSLIDYDGVQNINFNLNYDEKLYLYDKIFSYNDNFNFLITGVFYIKMSNLLSVRQQNLNTLELLNKIILRKKLSKDELTYFDDKMLNYEETKYYMKNLNNEKKIIKYFYNLLL